MIRMTSLLRTLVFTFPVITFFCTFSTASAQVVPTIFEGKRDAAYRFADSLMQGMSDEEKLGQMIMTVVYPSSSPESLEKWHRTVKNSCFGALLWQKGEPEDVVRMANIMRKESKIPMLVAMDGEWGLSMRLPHTIQYPRNMVLGAIPDRSLLKAYGAAVAQEAKRVGIHVSFGPVLDVNNNPKNPVIGTRSYGSHPQHVAECGLAYARGLEESGVLSCAKHFPGHGDTDLDSHKSLPVITATRERLDSVEIYPFRQYINRGMGSVMVGHLDIPVLGTNGGPTSLTHKVVTDLLCKELGFEGLIVTDGLGMKGVQLPKGRSIAVEAFQAGNDILLASVDPVGKHRELVQALRQGIISRDEMDRRCRKILAFKYALGVMNRTPLKETNVLADLNTPEHKELRDKLYAEGMTLLKNKGVLPLTAKSGTVGLLRLGKVQAGTMVRELSKQCKLKSYSIHEETMQAERKRIYGELSKCDRVVVVVTSENQIPDATLMRLMSDKPSALIMMESPYEILKWSKAIGVIRALAVGYQATVSAQHAMAQALMGQKPFKGKLPVDISEYYHFGDGVTLDSGTALLPRHKEKFGGLTLAQSAAIRRIAQEGLAVGAYPGCQVLIAKGGKVLYSECFGMMDGAGRESVSPNTLYDLASMTKALVVTPLMMMAVDEGKLKLSDPIAKYLPYIKDVGKKGVKISELMYHVGGMPASIPFYLLLIDEDSYTPPLLSSRRRGGHTLQIAARTYAYPHFKYSPDMVARRERPDYRTQFGPKYFLHNSVRDSIRTEIDGAPQRSRRYRYSDIDFLLLQDILESVYQKPLDELFYDKITRPLGLKRLVYTPLRYYPQSEIAEGAHDAFLRKSRLRGYVDDEAAAMMGGVSGNAGLFGNAEEVAVVAQMLLKGGEINGQRLISEDVVRHFCTTSTPRSPYLLGFDRARGRGKRGNTCEEAPTSTFGHTGFTGTCFWVDPENEWVYVFLSNRGCGKRWDNALSAHKIRQRIQQVMYY